VSDFLAALNAGVLMCWVSIYLGTGVSLVFFQFPTARSLTPENYHSHIVPQVTAATKFFTRMTQVMFVNGALMVWSEWGTWWVIVPIVVLLLVVLSTALTIRFIFPYNRRLERGITDARELRGQLQRWMRLNVVRSSLWALEWLTMMVWFVGKAA
jgi:hypothetical protein